MSPSLTALQLEKESSMPEDQGAVAQALLPTEGQDAAVVEHMVQRFLSWKLPADFNPDDGISFKPMFNENTDHPMRREPTGTNLFDYGQAKAMVLHMLKGSGR